MEPMVELLTVLEAGEGDRVRAIVEAEPLLARASGPNGATALHRAAAQGADALVDFLLVRGADAAQADEAGQDAADHAWRAGHRALSQRLRLAGAVATR
jgi:ankyrin repeat protein